MHWLRTKTHEHEETQLTSIAEVRAAFETQKESLYWIVLIITGDADLAEQSIADATSLAKTNNYAFDVWLAHWAQSATARVALNTLRSFIRETAAQCADWTCSHRRHEPLSPAETRKLRELDPCEVIERLDVLARTVLVLYGCQRVGLLECALLLDVPLRCVVGAYCRALQWCGEFAEPPDSIQQPHSPRLHFIHHDPDGVPVWGSEWPSAA